MAKQYRIGVDHMLRIRPYKPSDAETVLSWCRDEKSFYQWTAGILGGLSHHTGRFFASWNP